MTSTYRYDAFISYCRQEPDKAFARWLSRELENAGYKVAFDEKDFSPGATFLNEMERCCQESRFVLAVISPRYFESGNTEMESTIVTVQGMSERNNRLIPLIYEEVQRPTWMYSLVGVNFTDCDPLVPPLERLKVAMGEPLIGDTPAQWTTSTSQLPLRLPQSSSQPPAAQSVIPEDLQKRLKLTQSLSSLPGSQFEQILFAIQPPSGVVPPSSAPLGDRVARLLEWTEGPGGCGLTTLEAISNEVIQLIKPSEALEEKEPELLEGQAPLQIIDRGRVAVGSIASVQGNIYLGSRPNIGIPFQAPPLPSYYVDRMEARERLKRVLLRENEYQNRPLVVSAVYGLGGIGKSVLATALALDEEVQKCFPDGVLWATLGQQPEILSFLSNWIQALGDYDYKPTIIEAASTHLRSLLYERRMLLIVDDAWKTEDVEPFCIGGNGCQVLVTTREARVPGAARVDLEEMSANEALILVQGYLGKSLTSGEREAALFFARAVGYLPLALELAAAQIQEDLSWPELISAFEEEVARLEVLDAPDLDETKSEKARKQRSLRASFNLSIKRLKPEFLRRFAMMGVLPEDVSIESEAMSTIWNTSLSESRKTLRDFRRRSLLLDGAIRKDNLTYRMHDLMHDTAQSLVRDLLKLSLPSAHLKVLESYRALTSDGKWWTLPQDGYIHSNLTWHLEKADLLDEIHHLLHASDDQGRNAWFEVCDKLGQPALFVQDLARAWRLAEDLFQKSPAKSVSLQVYYALVKSTLYTLASSIPPSLMANLVKHRYWSIEQAWAYVEQMNYDVAKQETAIIELAKYLSESLMERAVNLVLGHQFRKLNGRYTIVLNELMTYLPEDLRLAALKKSESLSSYGDRKLGLNSSSIIIDAYKGIRRSRKDIAIPTQSSQTYADNLNESDELELKKLMSQLEAVRNIGDKKSQDSSLKTIKDFQHRQRNESLNIRPAVPLKSPQENTEESSNNISLELAKTQNDYSNFSCLLKLIASSSLSEDSVYQILNFAAKIENKSDCADILIATAPKISEELLPHALGVAETIPSIYHHARSMIGFLPYYPQILYKGTEWTVFLRLLANFKRSEFLSRLPDLAPAIKHFGGDIALENAITSIQKVCMQWR